jgi:hypothetical protein
MTRESIWHRTPSRVVAIGTDMNLPPAWIASWEQFDVALGAVQADHLPVGDQLRRVLDAHDRGEPYSRAITAPWFISPPTSVTRPLMVTNSGDQLGSVNEVASRAGAP